ncbi:unnamed protein product, partial [Owenia fusiformis]
TVAENAGYDLYCSLGKQISLHLGCYKDTTERDLPHFAGSISTLTPQICIETCRDLNEGYRYAGVQNGGQCFCGTSYGKNGSSSGCNSQCQGDSTQICGGVWANDIYVI